MLCFDALKLHAVGKVLIKIYFIIYGIYNIRYITIEYSTKEFDCCSAIFRKISIFLLFAIGMQGECERQSNYSICNI